MRVFGYVSEGMIPNRFDDYTNEPHYNTVDASLWYIHAAFEYRADIGDRETFETKIGRRASRSSRDIGAARDSTSRWRGGRADHARRPATQFTWMDAKMGDAFTPRQGKPVEINALVSRAGLMGEDQLARR